jgi:hypothetical protein
MKYTHARTQARTRAHTHDYMHKHTNIHSTHTHKQTHKHTRFAYRWTPVLAAWSRLFVFPSLNHVSIVCVCVCAFVMKHRGGGNLKRVLDDAECFRNLSLLEDSARV